MVKGTNFCKFNCFAVLFLLNFQNITAAKLKAKTTPKAIGQRQIAFKRAQSLNNGINISWLEQTWLPNPLAKQSISPTDFKLLASLGFKAIRLPVAFEFYANKNINFNLVYQRIDFVLACCKQNHLKLIIDYHAGSLDDSNYFTQTQRIINIWQQVLTHYRHESADLLFADLFNEPTCSPQVWKDAAYNIVTALRKKFPERTFLLGATNYNSIYELSRTERLADENLIYIFHFYEPFLFTHQGASWVGNQVATTGVPFPYNEQNFPQLSSLAVGTWGETNYHQYRTDGNAQSVYDKLNGYVAPWRQKYDVPVLCTEFGAYNKYADLQSRCNYIRAVKLALAQLKIPGMLWEYNGNFSVFEGKPSLQNLPTCMRQALLIGNYN